MGPKSHPDSSRKNVTSSKAMECIKDLDKGQRDSEAEEFDTGDVRFL